MTDLLRVRVWGKLLLAGSAQSEKRDSLWHLLTGDEKVPLRVVLLSGMPGSGADRLIQRWKALYPKGEICKSLEVVTKFLRDHPLPDPNGIRLR